MSAPHSLGSAVRWAYVMDGGRQVLVSLITFVLAALLGPEAFGIIAMALVYMAFVEVLLKQGMAPAVVQREDLRGTHLNTAFWIVMATALVLTALSAGLSGWWAAVNRTPQLQPVVLALTAMVPLQGLTVVQEALLRRQFRFRSLALRTNVSVLVGGVVGLVLALTGFGVWALVAQQITTALVAVVVLWAVSGWRPGLDVSWAAAGDLLGFSTGSFLGSLGVYFNTRADALLIGLLFGPVVVGLYRLASRMMESLGGVTVSALMSVSLPELSRAQNDPARFKRSVLRLTWVSAVLTIPAFGVLAGLAEPILGLLGEEWLPAVWALRLLCIAGAVRVVFTFTGPMLQALGRPYEQAIFAWVTALLAATGFFMAGILVSGMDVERQLGGLALSQALVYGPLLGAICMVIMWRRAHVTLPALARTVFPAVAAGVLAAVVGVLAWRRLATGDLPHWLALALAAVPPAIAGLAVVAIGDRRFRGHAGRLARSLRARLASQSGGAGPRPAAARGDGGGGVAPAPPHRAPVSRACPHPARRQPCRRP